jgi:hypothetical protein
LTRRIVKPQTVNVIMDDDFADAHLIENFDQSFTDSISNILTPEKHLDSPILVSLLDRLLDLTNRVEAENKHIRFTQYEPLRANAFSMFLHKNPDLAFSSIRTPFMQYCSALDFCREKPVILDAKLYPLLFSYSSYSPYRLQNDFELSQRIFDKELTAYTDQMKGIMTESEIRWTQRKLRPNQHIGSDVVLSAARAQLWSDIVEDYRKTYKQHTEAVKKTFGPVRVIHCDGFSLIKSDDISKWQLCTYEQLQMIQDCCLARHNIELALRFNFHNGTSNLSTHVHRVFKWQENVLKEIGNSGYELVKAPEAIFKAWLNTLTQGDLLPYSSYARTLDKMLGKEKQLHKKLYLVASLDAIVQQVTDIHDAAELFGLSKLSGHPSVYAENSAKSVRSEATPKGTISPFAVRQMNRMFKHLTLSGYIRYHTSWPKFLCPPALGTTLRRLYLNQVTVLPMGSYPMSDLDAIEFGKFVEYDYSEDYLKFLDDKAICPGAREMSKFWFSGARQETRRLLQKILELKSFSTVELIERLRKGNFEDDEYVVELTQKERELKIAARCFCKLPFSVRTFFTSTEFNLKEQFMSKYMPQQTMTMSNTDTKKRLYNMVKDAKDRSRTLLEVDFSRWNLRWREETVSGISLQLEQIFGLPGVFSQAHPFFERATVVLTDKHTLPFGAKPDVPVTEWPQSELLWRGCHKGGFEGIQQALWTICTIAMMYWVLHDQELSFLMAGQGDNQIFAITFDVSVMSMATQLRQLLGVMEVRCKLLNHEVKPDECIDSQTVLTYSKDIYVNGNHILYNLKFASRTFKREEIDVPSLSSEIASISACSMACADSVYTTPIAIFWKTFHTIRLMSFRYRSPNYRAEHASLGRILADEKLLEFAILLPGSLGGLPCMAWSRFFMKGEVDDLSWDVIAYRALGQKSKTIQWDLKLTLNGNYSPREPDLTQLILDPHSIPLRRPQDLKRLVKQAVEKELLGHTKNLWIRELASDQNVTAGKQFLEILATARPFYPDIMSDLYSLSPAGVRDALVARFTMTRTIIGITGNPNFSNEILSSNARLLEFIEGRYKSATQRKGIPELPATGYDTCKQLRKQWGEMIEHRNIGVYNPFDFKLGITDSSHPCISASSRCDTGNLHSTLGAYPPNFGTTTKQKVSDHGFKITTSSSTVRDLKKIVLTHSELGSSETLATVLTSIVSARSPWNLGQLTPILPVSYGGAAAHRHASINARAFSLLGSRTVPTHLNFCSDAAGILSGGEFDYPIAFQEFYLSLTNIFQVLTYCGALDPNASIAFFLTDNYEPLPSEPVECEVTRLPKWSTNPGNALCYITKFSVTEVPEIPHSSMMPHVLAEEIQPKFLIYNKLLAQHAKHRRVFKTTTTVNLPIEFIDMKEFNHCPLNQLLTGTSWFIAAMAIHTAVVEFTRNASVALHELVYKLSRSCSGVLARTMLHPGFSDSLYAIESGVVCEPGMSGARSAADNLTGELYNTALLHLYNRSFLTERVPLILFADYSSQIAHISEIHATHLIALQAYDIRRVVITPYQWLMIKSARYSLIAQSTPLYMALNYRSIVETLCHERNLRVSTPDGIFTEMRLLYCNMTPNEAIRALRALPKQIHARMMTPSAPQLSFRGLTGRIKIRRTVLDGVLHPNHTCTNTSEADRIVDHFLSLIERPEGIYSSAVSVWLQILISVKYLLVGRSVLSVGVGHGAVARAALTVGSSHVFGIDLRSSFPCVSQREGTYKPPEVVSSGFAAKFSWSRYVSLTGGDIRKVKSYSDLEPVDTVIIDIESDNRDLDPLFRQLPANCTVIVRLITCSDWLRYYVDALNTDIVYCTSQVETHKQSYILVTKKFNLFRENANFSRIDLLPQRPWRNGLHKRTETTVTRFNHIIGFTGESLKEISQTHLREVIEALTRRSYNMEDKSVSKKFHTLKDHLKTVIEHYRRLDTLTTTDILLLEPLPRRLLALWLSNTNLAMEQLRENLLTADRTVHY